MLGTPKTTQLCCWSPQGRGIAQSLPCKQALFYSPLWCELIAPSSQRLYMLRALWLIGLCWAGMAGKQKKKQHKSIQRNWKRLNLFQQDIGNCLLIQINSAFAPPPWMQIFVNLTVFTFSLTLLMCYTLQKCEGLWNQVFIQASKDVNSKLSL